MSAVARRDKMERLLQIVADCCRLLQIVADCCRLLKKEEKRRTMEKGKKNVSMFSVNCKIN